MKNSKRILSVTIKRMVDESPDSSYLEQEDEQGNPMFGDRFERYQRGDFCFIGIRAEASYVLKSWGRWETDTQMFTGGCGPIQTLTSGGLWGIESDSDASYLESVEQDELADLKAQLLALGFSKRAIATAFKNVERKDS